MSREAPSDIAVLLGDPTLPDVSKPGGRFTDDDLLQVDKLREALGAFDGYRFTYLSDHSNLMSRLATAPPRMVLNFCDTGFRNNAAHELHVAALLELLGIPFSGSGPVALGLCYDKALVRAVAAAHGVPVGAELFLPAGHALPQVTCPAFIKPNRGDGSVGIEAASIVHDQAQAQARVDELRAQLPGADLLVQEFLPGDEYGVGLIGNPGSGFRFLPVMRVDYDALPPDLPRLLDYGSKVDPHSPYWTDVRYPAASLDDAQVARLHAACETLFARLGLRDYARFDFRTDRSGTIRLMEVNPNPAWCYDGKLAHMGELAGLSHADVLGLIIEAAERRIADSC